MAILLLVVMAIGSLFVGVSNVTPWGLLYNQDQQKMVLISSRIPRLIAVLVSGTSMSVVGLIMQQLARNKFVSPSTAGTVQSASLGILVSILFFSSASVIEKMLIAFGFALAGTWLFMKILDMIKYRDVIFVPLVGIMFAGVIGSLTIFIAYQQNLLQTLGAWMVGDFSGVLRGRYELLYVAIPLMLVAYLYADRFTVAGLGENFALSLGLNYKQVVNIGLLIVALNTAVVVLTVGAIPFLGLIIPNIVTIFLGDNIKKTLPYTALLGGMFVLACDLIGRTIRYPYEIPISMVVGVIGSAIFLYLLIQGESHATQ